MSRSPTSTSNAPINTRVTKVGPTKITAIRVGSGSYVAAHQYGDGYTKVWWNPRETTSAQMIAEIASFYSNISELPAHPHDRGGERVLEVGFAKGLPTYTTQMQFDEQRIPLEALLNGVGDILEAVERKDFAYLHAHTPQGSFGFDIKEGKLLVPGGHKRAGFDLVFFESSRNYTPFVAKLIGETGRYPLSRQQISRINDALTLAFKNED